MTRSAVKYGRTNRLMNYRIKGATLYAKHGIVAPFNVILLHSNKIQQFTGFLPH